MKKPFLLLCLLALCLIQPLSAQTTGGSTAALTRFARKAVLFAYNNPQEKVYLHFDNTGYYLGENIWFKAYIVNAQSIHPSGLSKTLYVELLSPEGDIIQSKKLLVRNGVSNGDFTLNDSLPGGFYEVRAYTRCMLNFGPEVVFSRIFPVFDKPATSGDYSQRTITNRKYSVPNYREKEASKEPLRLDFFPEGGNLVLGLAGSVAFKATDKDGKSVEVSGNIVDATGKTITAFSTIHNGMGTFTHTPDGKVYTAKVRYDNKDYTFPLPTAENTGYTMHCQTPTPDSLQITLRRTNDLPESDTLAFVLTCRGKVIDFKTKNVPASGWIIHYPVKLIPSGVCQLTLYDVMGRIRCERLFFNWPSAEEKKLLSHAPLTIKTDKPQYKAYEKIQLEILGDTALTHNGSSISLSVKDASTSNLGNSNTSNIVTNFLFSSDLKGYIESPDWYFKATTSDRAAAMDVLMLTQGWRRYNWKRMEGEEPFVVKQPIEEGLLLDGEVRSNLFKKPMEDIKIDFWMTQNGAATTGKCVTDSVGKFSFLLGEMYGPWHLNIQTSDKESAKAKDLRILLNRTFIPTPKAYSGYDKEVWTDQSPTKPLNAKDTTAMITGEMQYTTKTTDKNKEGFKEYQLKEVVKIGRKTEAYTTLAARSANITYDVGKTVDKLRDVGKSEASTLLDMLRDENPYFNIVTVSEDSPRYIYKGKSVVFQIRNTTDNTEMGKTETRSITELLPQDVEKIQIIEDQSSLQRLIELNDGGSVLFMIYVYPQSHPKEPIGVRQTTFEGYSLNNEFYSPVHQAGVAIVEEDHRRTLYWNPELILDKTGKAKAEFYNNRTCNKLSVSAEGITGGGVLLYNPQP
jgi:hypothetical protein